MCKKYIGGGGGGGGGGGVNQQSLPLQSGRCQVGLRDSNNFTTPFLPWATCAMYIGGGGGTGQSTSKACPSSQADVR